MPARHCNLALSIPHHRPEGRVPTRLPWTRLRCWELTSLLPTLPVIGTKATEQVSQQPPRRARPGPMHVSEMSAAPLVSQAWPFPRRSAPRRAPYWQ